MRVLVLGGTGMLGRAVVRRLGDGHEVVAPPRADLDLRRGDDVSAAVSRAAPDAVVNCAGLVKQRAEAADALAAIEVNALLPHRLAALCRAHGARLVHISTDCVFSGNATAQRGAGGYREDDPPDPQDLYGRSKLLGEVTGPGALTLRLSLIGREAGTRHGLVEWFLAARGPVTGYANALFTGLGTPVAADLIARCLDTPLDGVWHAAAAPISKLDLLRLLRPDVALVVAEEPRIDRRLDGSALAARLGWRAPTWPEMVAEVLAS